MEHPDLDTGDAEFARQIIDLYSDIVVFHFFTLVQGEGERAGDKAAMEEFKAYIKNSNTYILIKDKFSPLVHQISQGDDGEAINRFQKLVNEHIVGTASIQSV